MNRYTIYCTTEQTKSALKLGAPILADTRETIMSGLNGLPFDVDRVVIPTTDQMIGWLEEQETITAINIDYYVTGNTWACWIKFKEGSLNKQDFISRREATLAAIDAALEYLENNKK